MVKIHGKVTIQEDVLDNQEILKNFNTEAELKALRDDAAKKLEEVREAKRAKDREKSMQDWAGKYVITYGRNYLKACSREDKSDIKIAHITSVDFKGRNFVRCNAHVIHIKYNDEHDWLNAGLNSEGYGQVQLEAYISPSFDIQDDEEVKTITKEEALKIINDARETAFIITDEWDSDEE